MGENLGNTSEKRMGVGLVNETVAMDATAAMEEVVKKLHSRLEQQSNLICMLKQRLDTTLRELVSSKKDCEASNEKLAVMQESLATGMRQNQLLEDRFYALASNHHEMIKLKDEYKEEARRLQGGDKEKLAEMEKRRMEVSMGEERVRVLEDQVMKVQAENKAAELERKVAKRRVVELEELQVCGEQQKLHQLALNNDECQASRAECIRIGTVVKKLQTQVCCLEEELAQSRECSQLNGSRANALQCQVDVIQAHIKEREQELNKDAKILILNRKLVKTEEACVSLEMEYGAYKVHSSELLANEKKLNQQLRHVLE